MAKNKSSFKWFGKKVQAKVVKASKKAVNFGLTGAVAIAKNNHSWTNRTGTAEGSIRIVETANRSVLGIISGLWGSVDTPHVYWLEFGSKPHIITARKPGGRLKFSVGGDTVYRRSVKHPGTKPTPFLRPANRTIFKKLGALLAREYARA